MEKGTVQTDSLNIQQNANAIVLGGIQVSSPEMGMPELAGLIIDMLKFPEVKQYLEVYKNQIRTHTTIAG